MTLDVLSGIKGAEASDAVNELFRVIKNARYGNESDDILNSNVSNIVDLDELRDDNVNQSSGEEKRLIKENFPKEKNGYLVVQKVIEE